MFKLRSIAAAAVLALAFTSSALAQVQNTLWDTTIGDVKVNSGVIAPSSKSLPLTSARADAGAALGTSAGTPTGAMGIARTAGTSLTLVGEATSSSAKTNKALWEITIPPTYRTGAAITVVVNANYTTTGTVTAASTSIALAAYTEQDGVEAAISGVTGAQLITATATNYTFVIPAGSILTPGGRVVLELTELVTTSAGAATGQVNRISLVM